MKNIKKIVSLLLAAAIVFALGACGKTENENETDTTTEAPKTHVVVDNLGKEVEVPYEINRIAVGDIFPLPSVLAVFFDSAEKIVGIAPTSMSAAKNSLLGTLYPEILKASTSFIEGKQINVEEVIKLDPDIFFYSSSTPATGENLAKAGIPAVAISPSMWEFDSIKTLNEWIALLSQIFPKNDKTEIVKKYSQESYDLVQERVAKLTDEQKADVFFLFNYDETTITTSGNNFFGHWWANAIGARNVGDTVKKSGSVPTNMEQIYTWNPDIIFITNFNSAVEKDIYENTVGNNDWSKISAVENKRVYKMPLGMYRSYTPGVDTPITLLWFAKTTYPDLFKDIDLIAKTVEYYKTVFGITITEAQAKAIFEPTSDAGKVDFK